MLKALTSARRAGILFPLFLLFGYGLLPAGLAWWGDAHPYFSELAVLSACAALCVFLGAFFPLPWHRLPKVKIRPELLLLAVWIAFFVFVLVVSATAERIPLVASLHGVDAETIAILRERFLKAREGWQASFVYLNAAFAGFLIPYCIALMFLCRFRLRWICFTFFLLYTLSFAEKGFFFKAMVPVFYLIVQRRVASIIKPGMLVAAMAGLLAVITIAARVGESGEDRSVGDFFSARYIPASPSEYMVWRAAAIPLVTAADALLVFHERLQSQKLWGATSSFLARLRGVETVPFERLVFAEQWGQNETGTGSANSVYLTEAYVNFGVGGVILFSFFVGNILRLFAKSRDEAFQSVWMLFCLNIYCAGLIGTLLSNGFLLLLFFATFVRFKTTAEVRVEGLAGLRVHSHL